MVAEWRRRLCMATEAKSLKTGDFILSKWEEEIEGEGSESLKHNGYHLPVRLGINAVIEFVN